ncbi:MAG: PQQ-binding-like beta-propeller repeat protein [Acidobacteriota bacterium]
MYSHRFLAVTTLLATSIALPLWASDWKQFAGEAANFSAPSAKAWPKAGPQELWRKPIGKGYSAIAAAGEQLFTMAREGDDDVVVAFDAATGEELWLHRYPAPTREGNLVEFGAGPHATPLVLDDRIVTLGYSGDLKALARDDGRVLWSTQLLEKWGGKVLPWGYSASPILESGRVVVLVGGDRAGAVAFDPMTGEPVWESAATSVSYATPLVIDLDGQRQLLYFGHDALHALDAGSGASLWKVAIKNGYENHASMPIWLPETRRLWVVSQQEAGGRVLQLERNGDRTEVEQLWANDRLKVHHWNSIVQGDTAYAAIGGDGGVLAGVDVATGEILWRKRGYTQANFVSTPHGTVALDEGGNLTLLDLSRKGVTERARIEALRSTSWTAPTVVGERIYLRDQQEIVAYSVAP